MKSNLNYKNPKKNIKPKRPLTSKNISKKSPHILATEESKKIYQTQGAFPNIKFLKQLSSDRLDIYLNVLNPADIAVISKVLPKYTFFQQLTLGAFEPKPIQSANPRTNYIAQKNRSSKSLGKLSKRGKNNIKDSDRAIFKQRIFEATGKNLIISKKILSLTLISFKIDQKLSKILSKGIQDNKSLQYLSINNCILQVDSFEFLLKGVLTHEILRFLDLSNNKLNDNYCPMISRIIQRQAQRRDQIVWSYQLRNEMPNDNNYKIGLISLNLHGNYLGPKSAKLLSETLNNDQYIRYIDLSKNYFDNSACKAFVHMMRKNNTLLTVDLRDNLGYDEFINPRIVMKMSKNIKYLYTQYQNGEYTEEEFEYLKGFIDISFFDVDIPQEIVQYYNNNLQQTSDNKNNNNNKVVENEKNINNNKSNNSDEKDNPDENINEINNNEQQEVEGSSKKNQEINTNKQNINPINEKENNNNEYQKNQKLLKENLKLKKEIEELKAKNSQSIPQKEIPRSKEEEKELENYYNRANQIIDTLNEVMSRLQQQKDKNGNNININEINNLIAIKKNEILDKNKKVNEQDEISINKNKNNAEININNEKKSNKIIIDKKNDNINDKKEIKEIKEKKEIKEINNKKEVKKENKKEINENININKKEEDEIKLNKEKEKPKINNIQEKKETKKLENNTKEEKKISKESNINNNINKKELMNNSDDDEDEDDFDLNNLTEEEKMALLQQREIIMKLQEEAEARGEHFDIQEYFAQLAEQSEDEDDFGQQQGNKSDNKLNKSF